MCSLFFCCLSSYGVLLTGSSLSSSHMSGNNIDNRLTSHDKTHDSNSINQNFTIDEKQLQQPHFDHSMPRNVTLKVGQTAFLSCRVKQLGDKLVSSLLFIFISFYLSCPRFAPFSLFVTRPLCSVFYLFHFSLSAPLILVLSTSIHFSP